MVFSHPPWLMFLINFSLTPPQECKQLRDEGGHPEYLTEHVGEGRKKLDGPLLTLIF